MPIVRSSSGPERNPRRELLRRTRLAPVLLATLLLPLDALGPTAVLLGQDTPPPELAGIPEFIERGMRDWEIPGLAITVVKDDRVVWSRGFGIRKLGDPAPVDRETIFNVASVSKAFTATALGILVDDGLLHWDDPVVRHIPEFRLYDPYVTETVTIRDLLAHRVGVGRMTGNRLRWISNRPRDEQIRRIRHLGPEQTFRNGYVYSNVMYMVAGEIVPRVTGRSWEDFVSERIFAPLGMRRSAASLPAILGEANLASPHQEIDGVMVEIPRRNFDAVGPAASVHTTASDIAAWIRLHLGDPGVFEGRRLVQGETMAEMRRAQTALRGAAGGPLSAYGMGWNLGSWEGRPTAQHGGAVDGMNTTLVLVPSEGLGIFVTTNAFNDFMTALSRQIMDAYFGIEGRDWHAALFDSYRARKAAVQAQRDSIHEARVPGTAPSGPLRDFAGLFLDSLYADARVEVEGDRLVLTLSDDDQQIADLEHWHFDTFRAIWRNRAQREEFLWFTRGPSGEVTGLHIDWNLRPALLQVGAYPSPYRRVADYRRSGPD